MEVYRIEITSWTASFRYPNIISGYQPSLFVPPISTVLGIINSCAGKYLDFDSELLGYYFDFVGKTDNIENIHKMEQNSKGSLKPKATLGIITRQVLFGCRLYIYMKNPNIVDYFRKPVFQVTLGRSCDLATIDKIIKVDLPQKELANSIRGQLIPFAGNFLPGMIQALPQYFTNTIPRENIGTQPYSVISYDSDSFETSLTAYTDFIDNKEIDIYFHKLNFGDE